MKRKKTKKPARPRGNPGIREVGKSTRFVKGRSGNPGGRPSAQPFAEAFRRISALPITQLRIRSSDTTVDAVVKAVYRAATRGNTAAAREAADRCEGTPRQAIALEQTRPIEVRVSYVETVKKLKQFYGLDYAEPPSAAKTPPVTPV